MGPELMCESLRGHLVRKRRVTTTAMVLRAADAVTFVLCFLALTTLCAAASGFVPLPRLLPSVQMLRSRRGSRGFYMQTPSAVRPSEAQAIEPRLGSKEYFNRFKLQEQEIAAQGDRPAPGEPIARTPLMRYWRSNSKVLENLEIQGNRDMACLGRLGASTWD